LDLLTVDAQRSAKFSHWNFKGWELVHLAAQILAISLCSKMAILMVFRPIQYDLLTHRFERDTRV
jgi:hypothetical protein